MKRGVILAIVVIFGVAAFLRLYKVAQIPYAMDGDEAAFGYYAYSIGRWGIDEYGNKLPVYFPSIGDYKFPAYVYLTVPWVKIFGLSEWSTRMTSVLAGLITIAGLMILTARVTKNINVGLTTAMLVAISPWHIMLSRGAYEVNLGVMFAVMAALAGYHYWRLRNTKWLMLAAVCVILGMYSYSAVRLFLVITATLGCGALAIWNRKEKLLMAVLVLAAAVGLLSFIPAQSRARAAGVSIFNYQPGETTKHIARNIHVDGIANQTVSLVETRAVHNKLIEKVRTFASNFLIHWDLSFLFIKGDPRNKFGIPDVGPMLIVGLPLLLAGLAAAGKYRPWIWAGALLWWVAGTIPTALTTETPNVVRYLPALPAMYFLSGVGLATIGKKRLMMFALVLALGINFAFVWHFYTVHKLFDEPWYTDGGVKEMVQKVSAIQSQYKQVVMGNDPYIFFLFYNKANPYNFMKSANIAPEEVGKWNRVKTMGNITFGMPGCPKIGKQNVLYVCTGDEVPQGARIVELFRFKDSYPAFTLLKFVPYEASVPPLPPRMKYMLETDMRFGKDALIPDTNEGWWF